MFKIGAFSKLSRLSIKTLRYYDQRALLKPSHIDESTGYRYYTAEQLLTVQRINAFKEQGFTLEEIKQFLDDEISSAQVMNSLQAKQLDLQNTIQKAKRQLDEIQSRKDQLEKWDKTVTNSIILREVKPQLVASVRDVVPRSHLCLLLNEIKQYIGEHGENKEGHLIIQWHNSDLENDYTDLEVALPISKNIPGSDRVHVGILPKLKKAASLVHQCDPYHSSCLAIDQIASWVSSKGYTISEDKPIREVYLTSDKDIYGILRMSELLVPVEIH